MLPIARRRYLKPDPSRTLFGALLLSLMGVACLLVGSGDIGDAAADDEAKARSKNADASQVSPAVSVPPTLTGRIVYVKYNFSNNHHSLMSVNPDGTGVVTITTVLTNPSYPKWSPDGSKIAVTTGYDGDHRIDLYVMNRDGSGLRTVHAQDGLAHQTPAWSPDGTQLVFSMYDYAHLDDGSQIYKINLDGTGLTRLTDPAQNSFAHYSPDWSPDGTRIVFIQQTEAGTSLYDHVVTMNANGSGLQDLMPGETSNAGVPDWSPDGTRILLYLSDTQNNIAIMNADGSNRHYIPNLPYNSFSPSWSPDGNWFSFENPSYSNGQDSYIQLSDLTGTAVFTVTEPNVDVVSYYPSWGTSKTVVQVNGSDNLPVPGAQVFRNCDLVGTTSITGTLTLNQPLTLGDELIARTVVYTGTTQKAGHDGWAYHVWLTNILENNDGTESVYSVTDANMITHTLVLSPTNARIGFNIVASYEYNTSDEQLAQVETGFREASERLMDVTDGQMFFERVTLYEDKQHFEDADFQFTTDNVRANADAEPDGISELTGPTGHIRMYGPDDFGLAYDQPRAYSTLVHEFGHYALGAYDEYYKWNGDDYPTSCTLDLKGADFDYAASMMNDHESTSEFCSTISPDIHNPDTAQGYLHGESVWETIVDNWSNEEGLWELRSPMTRGTVDKGPVPSFLTCPITLGTEVNIVTVPGAACAPIGITADYSNGNPAEGAGITLKHNGNYYDRGTITTGGIGTVVGAEVGDTVLVSDVLGGIGYNASFVLTQCHGIGLVLTATVPLAKDQVPLSEAPTVGEWPAHGLTAVPNWSNHQVDLTLQFAAEPPATPALYATQGSSVRQAVTLTYNAGQHQYTGTYTFSDSFSPDFQFDVEMPISGGVNVAVHKFLAGQFHNTGPNGYEKMKNIGTPHGNDPSVAPVAWGLLRPESMADVVVNPTSLPDGTGVMVGKAGLPADAPTNLIAVGGPYSVQGQNAINGEVGITLAYISEHYCGLQPGTPSIYKYTGTGWEAIDTTFIDEWHMAGGKISEWGIYGVFAQPNAQITFSDVPAGSTFYDYINWITCHGIASGYSDSTFRPNNNATRGQISKMMVSTYRWRLGPPANDYTFADVLPESTFYLYVEAAYREGVLSGYECGGTGEPCDSADRPYFRPSNNVTRGQIAKIISNGSKFTDVVTGQQFEDVPAGSTFYDFIGRMASRQIINGYECGGPGEPCGSGNLPYFRPSANATRGQLSKMIYLAAQPR